CPPRRGELQRRPLKLCTQGEVRTMSKNAKTPASAGVLLGGSDRRRSGDLSIFSRTLYQLSYRAWSPAHCMCAERNKGSSEEEPEAPRPRRDPNPRPPP